VHEVLGTPLHGVRIFSMREITTWPPSHRKLISFVETMISTQPPLRELLFLLSMG
jgi:hypothetical protein